MWYCRAAEEASRVERSGGVMNESCVADRGSDQTRHANTSLATRSKYLWLRTILVLSVFVGLDYRVEQRTQCLPMNKPISQSHFVFEDK